MDLAIAVFVSFLSTVLLVAVIALISRRLMLVRRLGPALYLGSLAAGLKVFTLFEAVALAELEQILSWVLLLLAAVAVIKIAGLYFFDVYLHSTRGVRLPPLLPLVVMGTAYLIAALVTFKIAFPGIDISPLVATSAVTSLVLGLALQPILGNFFSGLVISLEKPFRINDWIQVGDTEGLVTDITWRTTHVRTRDNDKLVIPNSEIAGREITNYHYPHPLHLERIEVGVSYRTPPYRVREALLAAARVEGVLDKPTPEVYLKSFDDSSIGYELRIWLEDHAQKQRTNSRVRESIWENFKSRGITIPFPIRTLEFGPQPELLKVASLPLGERPEAPRPAAFLFVADGPDQGRSLQLDGSRVTLGRSHSCSMVLRELQASKEHCSVELQDGSFVLKDLGSQNGTRVNGRQVKETMLRDMDRIRIGQTEIVFESDV